MYKIYINETPLYLASTGQAKKLGENGPDALVLRYAGKRKFLLNVISQLEASQRFRFAVVFHENLPELWATFCEIYQLIEAAGGVVFNEQKQVLAIYRRGSWDLPKGKIDPGETPEQAAVREVQEETGLANIQLGAHLTDTWHTYKVKQKRILKRTYWYLMTAPTAALTPQQEEDIEEACWAAFPAIADKPPGKIYNSILAVLAAAKTAALTAENPPVA